MLGSTSVSETKVSGRSAAVPRGGTGLAELQARRARRRKSLMPVMLARSADNFNVRCLDSSLDAAGIGDTKRASLLLMSRRRPAAPRPPARSRSRAAERKDSEARLRLLAEQVPARIGVVDRQLRILWTTGVGFPELGKVAGKLVEEVYAGSPDRGRVLGALHTAL